MKDQEFELVSVFSLHPNTYATVFEFGLKSEFKGESTESNKVDTECGSIVRARSAFNISQNFELLIFKLTSCFVFMGKDTYLYFELVATHVIPSGQCARLHLSFSPQR